MFLQGPLLLTKLLNMKKLLIIGLTFMVACSSRTPLDNSINNPIYKTAIKFSNEKTWWYDASYYKIPYPNGDVPSGGACSDVVIRVLRECGMDLQQLIHEDMVDHFDEYPHKWGLTAPDPNIDHRRVPNIMKYFERMGYNCSICADPSLELKYKYYQPGDIVVWELAPNTTHIGIILNKNGDVYHNMGPKATITKDFLFNYNIIGHYRINDL